MPANAGLMMPKIPFLALIPLAIFAALAGLFVAGMNREDPDALPSVFEGASAPAITGDALPGFPGFDSSVLTQPGVKIVNYWASWCAPCRAEHPTLVALAESGLPVYGINYRDDPAKATAFLAELGNPYRGIVTDPNSRTAIEWGVYGVPETYVIDSAGRVVLRFAGPVTQRALASTVQPAIDKAR